jgi:hypothetical protein
MLRVPLAVPFSLKEEEMELIQGAVNAESKTLQLARFT